MATLASDLEMPDLTPLDGALAGHLGGITVAHDRSVERYRGANAFITQAVMLVMMVLYSTVGLWLLLGA